MQNFLIATSFFYTMLIASVLYFSFKKEEDKFSPIKIHAYFSLIEAFLFFWYAVNYHLFSDVIFQIIGKDYHSEALILKSYWLSIFIYGISLVGIRAGQKIKKTGGVFSSYMKNLSSLNAKFFILVFLFGIITYLIFIFKMGGFYYVWRHIGKRTELSAGLGYLELFYTYCLILSSAYLFVYFYKKNKKMIGGFLALLVAGILGSLTQRYFVGSFIFVMLLVCNYQIKKINFFSRKFLLLIVVSIVFMQLAITFRHKGLNISSENVFATSLLRFGILEREITVLGYFQKHEYWGNEIYKSVIYSPIPRAFLPTKPPVDTGVYLRQMSEGVDQTKESILENYEKTSWPDGALAGYISFGLLGLAIVCLLSGVVLGGAYEALRESDYNISLVFFYGIISFLGLKFLSPMGIVFLLSALLFLIVIREAYTRIYRRFV